MNTEVEMVNSSFGDSLTDPQAPSNFGASFFVDRIWNRSYPISVDRAGGHVSGRIAWPTKPREKMTLTQFIEQRLVRGELSQLVINIEILALQQDSCDDNLDGAALLFAHLQTNSAKKLLEFLNRECAFSAKDIYDHQTRQFFVLAVRDQPGKMMLLKPREVLFIVEHERVFLLLEFRSHPLRSHLRSSLAQVWVGLLKNFCQLPLRLSQGSTQVLHEPGCCIGQ